MRLDMLEKVIHQMLDIENILVKPNQTKIASSTKNKKRLF